jgi:hypothetical protein
MGSAERSDGRSLGEINVPDMFLVMIRWEADVIVPSARGRVMRLKMGLELLRLQIIPVSGAVATCLRQEFCAHSRGLLPQWHWVADCDKVRMSEIGGKYSIVRLFVWK